MQESNKLFVQNLKDEITKFQPVPITSLDGKIIGELCLITRSLAAQTWVAELIMGWRAKYMEFFLSVFEPSLETTRHYLNEIYMSDSRRLFFLLKEKDRYVGNFGLANIAGNEVELDNMIRGESVIHKGYMHHAELSLMGWANQNLGSNDFYLHVLSSNQHTVKHHERVGFSVVSSLPLKKEKAENGYRLVKDLVEDKDHFKEKHLCLLRMEMKSYRFPSDQ